MPEGQNIYILYVTSFLEHYFDINLFLIDDA